MISDQYNLKQFAPLFLNKISVSVGLRQSKQSLLQICVPVVVKINTISYVICHFLLSRSMRSAWIEIPPLVLVALIGRSRSMRSVWVEIRPRRTI